MTKNVPVLLFLGLLGGSAGGDAGGEAWIQLRPTSVFLHVLLALPLACFLLPFSF